MLIKNILVIYAAVAHCLNQDFNYLRNLDDEVQYLSNENSIDNGSFLKRLIRKRSSAPSEINSLITVNEISAKKSNSPTGRFNKDAKFLNPPTHFNKKRKRAVSTLDKISVGDANSNANNEATEKSSMNGTTPLEIGDETEYCGQRTTPTTTTTELDPCFSPTTTESAQSTKPSPKCVQKKECVCETTECATTPQECEETTPCPTETTTTCPTTTTSQECEETTTCPPPTITTCPTISTSQECEEITTCPTATTTVTTCATTPQECQETTTPPTTCHSCPSCSMKGRKDKECPSCVNSLKELSVLLNKLINKIGPHQKSVQDFQKRNNNEKNPQQKRKRSRNRRKWGEWTDWSSCSVSCGKGRQIKWRQCEDHCQKVETELLEKACQKPACSGKLFGFIKL